MYLEGTAEMIYRRFCFCKKDKLEDNFYISIEHLSVRSITQNINLLMWKTVKHGLVRIHYTEQAIKHTSSAYESEVH